MIFSRTRVRLDRRTPKSLKAIPLHFLRFGRHLGTTMEFCRLNRPNWRSERHSSTTTSFRRFFAPLNRQPANNDLRVRLIGDGSPALQRIPTDRGFAGNSGWVRAWTLRNYLEFTFKAEYAYDYGMPQWLAGLDHVFSPLRMERLFLGRHKLYHYRVLVPRYFGQLHSGDFA